MLFTPLPLKNVTLPNRLVRSATYEGAGDAEGTPGSALAEVYARLCLNEVGTLITGFNFISREGRAMHPRQCGIDSEDRAVAWGRVVSSVKRESPGTVLLMQLAHAGRQTLGRITGSRPLAPSSGASPYFRERPVVLDEAKIWSIVTDFARAAKRAQGAGFDGVQLHAAHGYLIHQFLSPALNRRPDRWGRDRGAFLREVLRAVKGSCGEDFPVFLKISGGDDDPAGISPRLAGEYLTQAEQAGAEAAEVSFGTMDLPFNIFRGGIPIERVFEYNPLYSGTPKWVRPLWRRFVFPFMRRRFIPFREDYNAEFAREIHRWAHIPLILVGGIRDLGPIEDLLKSGACDAVSVCRPLICEPDLGSKFRTGQARRSRCANCNACAVMCDSGEPTRCYASEGPLSEEKKPLLARL